MTGHWHIAYGLYGYGPDGADGFDWFETLEDVADALHGHDLAEVAADLEEQALSFANDGDYESAWKAHMYAEKIDVLRHGFNPKRAQAPLYVDDPGRWRATILGMIDKNFPLQTAYGVPGGAHLYVWNCSEAGCEHEEE